MDISSLTLKDILEYLHTPVGRLIVQGFLVFIGCEAIRLFAEKLLDVQTKLPLKKIKVYAEGLAYLFHVVLGLFASVVIFYFEGWYKIITASWWIIIASMFFHIAYVKYISKKIEQKIKGEK